MEGRKDTSDAPENTCLRTRDLPGLLVDLH